MNNESLGKLTKLHALEAEVKHLKGLLNKVSPKSNANKVGLNKQFESKLEGLLQKGLDYNNVVLNILKEIGQQVDVDRLSIYSYDEKGSGYLAKYQWCSDRFQEYHPTDIVINDNENPLISPTHEKAFVTWDLNKDLTDSLALKFETFQVQSLLIISYCSAEVTNGFLVFETCTFAREWYDFEIQELSHSVKTIVSYLNTYWYKKNAEKDLYLRDVLNNAISFAGKEKQSKRSILKIFELIGFNLKLEKVYFVPHNSFSNHHEFFWSVDSESEENVLNGFDVEKIVNINEGKTGFIIESQQIKKQKINVDINNSISVNSILINNDISGWFVTEFQNSIELDTVKYLHFTDSISHIIGSLLSDLFYESELNTRCLYLLESNKGLTQKEAFLDSILKNAPIGILKLIDGVVKLTNDKGCEIFELSSEELLNKKISDLLLDKDILGYLKRIRKEESGINETFEIKAGLYTKVLSVLGTLDYSNRESGYVLFVKDITSYQNIEKKYDELRDRYERILESSVNGIFITDINGSIKFINKTARSIINYDLAEATHLNIESLIDKSSNIILSEVQEALSTGKLYRVVCKFKSKDGNDVSVDFSAQKIQIDGKEHIFITVHEIPVLTKIDSNIEVNNKGFDYLAESVPDIILRLNKDRQVIFYNESFISHFDFLGGEEVLGKSLTELDVFNDVVGPTWQAKVDDVFNYGEKISMELGFSDESKELYFDWIITPEHNDRGDVETVLAIGRSLSEHKQVEKLLMDAKEKAEESDKLKSSFLANMSHELRTPLNAIVGFSALLRGDNITTEEKDDYVEVIHKNSDSLMSLINNIIDVAKIESGKISVEKENLDLHVMLNSLFSDFAPKVDIEHKGRVKLYLSMPENDKCIIYSDPIRLRQTLVNLIGNAIKFTIKGFVEFGYTKDRDEIRFFVKDTGIGISDAKQKVIFQPFRKEVETSNQIYGGTGVGLSICEKIVHALGGKIGLTSEKGNGSEFFFTHPNSESDDLKERVNVLHKKITIANPVLPKNYYWPNKLILLVDENSSVHLQMRKFIEKTGVTLVSARTGAGASKLLMNRKDIALVIMDLKFPDLTGSELIKEIKSQNKELPVIAHSEKISDGYYGEILKQGFDACIAKSNQKDELLMIMDKFLVEANNTK